MRVRLTWSLIVLFACAPCAAFVLTLSDSRKALAAALHEVIEALPSDTAAVCLTLPRGILAFWYSPGPRLLEELRTPRHRIVGPRQCPQTYGVPYVLVDSTGRNITPVRPLGYIDPHDVVVDAYQLLRTDSVSIEAIASQGTLHRHFTCTARRGPSRVWRARCESQGMSLSAVPPKRNAAADKRES